MAKTRKKADTGWDVNTVGEFLKEQFRTESLKGGLQSSAEAAASTIGIRLPHLSQRYLFQRSSFPLERNTILFGPTGSNKSSLLFYFYDLFAQSGGGYLHLEVEDKDAPGMRLAMTNYNDDVGRLKSCSSMTDFQAAYKYYVDWIKSKFGAASGPGKRIPFVFGIDSLMAKLTAEGSAAFDKNAGASMRRFADEARSLSDWFKYAPEMLQDWPFCLICVNHDKPKPGQTATQVIHHTPGGAAPNYYATYKVLVQKIKFHKQNMAGVEGNRLRLTMEKSSLSTDKQSIEVDCTWSLVPVKAKNGKTVLKQEAKWGWDSATVDFLYHLQEKKLGARGKAVDEILDLVKCSAGRYAARAIGVPTSDPLPPAALGALIETKEDVLAVLEPRLGIHPSYHFEPGVPFDDQKLDAIARMDEFVPTKDSVPIDGPVDMTVSEDYPDTDNPEEEEEKGDE